MGGEDGVLGEVLGRGDVWMSLLGRWRAFQGWFLGFREGGLVAGGELQVVIWVNRTFGGI